MKNNRQGDAYLIRDKDYKMRRAIFFLPQHAEEYKSLMLRSQCEIVKVRLKIELATKGTYVRSK